MLVVVKGEILCRRGNPWRGDISLLLFFQFNKIVLFSILVPNNWSDLPDPKEGAMENRVSSLEKLASDHGKQLAKLKADLEMVKESLPDMKEIKELLLEFKKHKTPSEEGERSVNKGDKSESDSEGKDSDDSDDEPHSSWQKKVVLPTLKEDEPEPESQKMTAQEGSLVEGLTKGEDEINIQSLKLGQIAVIMGPNQRLGVVLGKGRTDPMRTESGRMGQVFFQIEKKIEEQVQSGNVGTRTPLAATTLKWRIPSTLDDGPPPPKPPDGPSTVVFITLEALEAHVAALKDSITSCLKNFSSTEALNAEDNFFWDKCCNLKEALKRMKIQKPPHNLVIHLKRFKYMKQLGHYKKRFYWVVFPLELKLSNTMEDGEAWHIDDQWKYPP